MQQKNIAKNKASFELLIVLLASFCVLCILGSTLAWFTNNNDLTGSGTTPNAEVNLYSNGVFLTDGSGNASDITEVFGPVYNKTIERDTTSISGSVQFDTVGSNIDLLAVASVSINFFEVGTNVLVDNTDSWASINISNSAWTKGADGRYYYNSKISSSSSSKITLFDNITINNTNAEGKTLEIIVFVEVIQANQTGIDKLSGTSGYALPNSFKNLV